MASKQLTDLHDARLIAVMYLTEASIRLDFEKVDTTRKSVLLMGVVHFFCTGMLEGNIVDGFEVIDVSDISEDDIAYFVRKEGRGQSVDTLRQTIDSKRLSMALLSPSYGAEMGCVCSGVR